MKHSQILVVNSLPIIREGLVAVFRESLADSIITGSGSFPEALALIAKKPVDLVVSTFRVQGDIALSFLQQLKESGSTTRCLILSSLDEIQTGYPCIRAGASGFVKKSSPVSSVVDAVRMVLAGNLHVSEQLSKALMERHGAESIVSAGTHLTPRELQIFSFIGEGMAVSTIAVKLGLSVRTVEAHRDHIKNKLGHQSAAQVTAAAVRWLDDSSFSI